LESFKSYLNINKTFNASWNQSVVVVVVASADLIDSKAERWRETEIKMRD